MASPGCSTGHNTEMIDRCLEALRQAHDAGIDSIIDLTPFDLGRQVWLFDLDAETPCGILRGTALTPLNKIVCATGVYRWVPVVYYGWDEDEIASICALRARDP